MLSKFISYYTDYLKDKSKLEPFHISRVYSKKVLYTWNLIKKEFVKIDGKRIIWLETNFKYLEFIAESNTNILLFFNGNSKDSSSPLKEFFSDIKQEIMSIIFTKEDKEIFKTVNAYLCIENETKNISSYFDTKYTEGKFFISTLNMNMLNLKEFSKLREIHSSKESIPNTHYLLEDLVEKIQVLIKEEQDPIKHYIVDSLRSGKDVLDELDLIDWLFNIRELESYEFDILKNSINSSSEKLVLNKVNRNSKNKYVLDTSVHKEFTDIFNRYLQSLINEVK